MSESKVITSVAELADQVIGIADGRQSPDPRTLIAIAGPPGSGKSTVAEALVDLLNARTPETAAVFPMDGYHYDDIVLNDRGHRARKGAPHTFDVAGFSHMLGRLRRNDEPEVAVPVFDRSIEIARAGARIIPKSVEQLIVEGNYLLLDVAPWESLAEHFDTTVFIDVEESVIRRRLLDRWADLSAADLEIQLDGNDMANVRLVQSRSRFADFTLRGTVI